MGLFSGPKRSKTWNSTGKYRDLLQSNLFEGKADISKIIEEGLSQNLGLINAMGANATGNAQMQANRVVGAAAPGSVNSVGTQAYMQMAPQFAQMQLAAQQQAGQQKIASIADFLNGLQGLAALSGGSKGAKGGGIGYNALNSLATNGAGALGSAFGGPIGGAGAQALLAL